MGEEGPRGAPPGNVPPGGQTTPAPVTGQAARNPSWGRVLATTISLWLSRRMPRVSIEWPDMSVSTARTAANAVRNPSWGRVLVTTVSLWASRRVPRVSVEWRRHPGARRSNLRGSYGRLLAASMLGLGLLATGAATAGLAVAGYSAAAAIRLPARPTPVPAPSGRTVTPVWLTTVQRTAAPVSLTIPAIGVRTKLVDLGLNSNGTLQVPATTAVAGWYTGSPRPGEIGAAVIAGHVDSRSGLGIFFWLRNLRPGDRVYVGRADGTMAVFTVTSVRMYAKDEFPTAAVYGPVPDAELRLITCGGIFDRSAGSYLSNVVVFARLTAG
jgi:sortase (surface protein transpeptidase)